MKIFILISILGTLLSCAKAPQTVETKISFGAALTNTATNYDGGLYILGHNGETDEGFKKKIDGNELIIDLPHGNQWRFGAIGWVNGANKNFEGEAFCSMSTEKYIINDEIKSPSIQIDPQMHTCDEGPFGGKQDGSIYTQVGELLPLKFMTCIEDIGYEFSDFSTAASNCQSPSGALSVKVVLHSFELSPVEGQKTPTAHTSSECISLAQDGGNYDYEYSNVKIPIYENIPVSFELYPNTNCSNLPIKTIALQGFKNLPSDIILDEAPSGHIKLLFKQSPTSPAN